MTKEALKNAALQAIDANRETIIKLAKSIWDEPEEGYREYKTAQKIEEIFAGWEIPSEKGLALTGVKGRLKGKEDGPTICVMGELDAVCNPDHPEADPETGMVHACAHASQLAWLIGSGFGLKDIIGELHGNAILFAVPAEEYLNLEFRQQLKDEGKIEYFGGKQELIRLGAFDDVDIALMCHGDSSDPGKAMFIPSSTNGFIGKSAEFLGRTAHAGAAPEKGLNALNAFNLALSAIHAQRETFRDEDMVRVHPVVTKGGEGVNNVPSDVRTEMYVRAKTVDAIRDANKKVDRALKAGAMGIGTRVQIVNTPGYLPLVQEKTLTDVWVDNSTELLGAEHVHFVGHNGASTDMGDITHILPGIHPFSGGFQGVMHGSDFLVSDEEMAYIIPAKLYAMTVIDLLYDDAHAAREIMQNFTPTLSKKEYLSLLDSFSYTQLWSEEEA
ncbi:amidohydrolase [candidate division KSB3 bacterium]|uniref:Amidohydrolase n=1 Tax=candidate division KSB3 bacterium TaxID=2044937 RepID=A0A2G6KGZ1_9BACT|nr:MAG: amidohydrolase [candidate division KSB3 bacterium]